MENVAEEFFQLSVPRSSEILDVAAGSGIVSALLQTGGNQIPDSSRLVHSWSEVLRFQVDQSGD